MIFEGKKIIELQMCVLIFPITFFWKNSFYEELSEILSEMYIVLRVKYRLFLSDFKEAWISWKNFQKEY
jgi:hypothetical protein